MSEVVNNNEAAMDEVGLSDAGLHSRNDVEEMADDEELSDDEFDALDIEELIGRVESNDPSLTKAGIWSSDLAPSLHGGQCRFGTCIGRNAHLKAIGFCCDHDELYEEDEQVEDADIENLFRGIAFNQFIKRYSFSECGDCFEKIIAILSPQFKKNQVERLSFEDCDVGVECLRTLAAALAEFDSLKDFAFTKSIGGVLFEIQHLLQALSRHSGLRELDLAGTSIGRSECAALKVLLHKPKSNLKVLNLVESSIGDEEAIDLAAGIAGNSSLKVIDLSENYSITEIGWKAIFGAMNSTRCRLEKLTLCFNSINSAAAQVLSSALANMAVKSLDLGYNNESITAQCWRRLFGFLTSSKCALEKLYLTANSNDSINDEVVNYLADALSNNATLKSFDLSWRRGVTGTGWQRFFQTNPISGLERLDVAENSINDVAIQILADTLVNNTTLKEVDLRWNRNITNTGWENLCAVIASPHSALEKLDFRRSRTNINDATSTLLVNSSMNNKTLKALLFDHSDDWEPSSSVFSNTASIMDAYNSNHTLEQLCDEANSTLPEEIKSLLKINREHSASEAARLKIIKTHFREGFDAKPFVGMDSNVLPHAMAWMGRDGGDIRTNGHFYKFVREKHTALLSMCNKSNKRKRSE